MGNVIGEATQFVGKERRAQVCTGTYRGDFPDPRFRFNILFVEHTAPFPMHSHEYSELVVVLEGRSTHRTDREDYPIAAGDVFVINGTQRHGFPDPEGLRLCNVQFDPAQLLAGQRDLERMMGYHALFDLEPRSRLQRRLRLTPPQLAQVQALLRTIEEEFRSSAEGRETVIRSTFLLLVAFLSRFYGDARKADPSPVARMANVVAYTRRHFHEPIRVATLSRMAHLSASQFQRAFKQAFHTTPHRLIRQLRIEHGCELLKDSGQKIAAIAEATGFGSAAFFSTEFKRFTGMTPREYRRRHAAR